MDMMGMVTRYPSDGFVFHQPENLCSIGESLLTKQSFQTISVESIQ